MICDEINCGQQMSFYCNCDKYLCNNHISSHTKNCEMEKIESKHYISPMTKLQELKLAIISAVERLIASIELNSSSLLNSLNRISPKLRNIKHLPTISLDPKYEQKAEKYIKAFFIKSYSDSLSSSLTITHPDSISIQSDPRISENCITTNEFEKYRMDKEKSIKISLNIIRNEEIRLKELKESIANEKIKLKELKESIADEYKKGKQEISDHLWRAKNEIEKAFAEKKRELKRINKEKENALVIKRNELVQRENVLSTRERSFEEHLKKEGEKLEIKAAYLENYHRNKIYAEKNSSKLSKTIDAQGMGSFQKIYEGDLEKKIAEIRKMNLEEFEEVFKNSYIKIKEAIFSLQKDFLFLCICYLGTAYLVCIFHIDINCEI